MELFQIESVLVMIGNPLSILCPFCKNEMHSPSFLDGNEYDWLYCYCDGRTYYNKSTKSWDIKEKYMTEDDMTRYIRMKAFW